MEVRWLTAFFDRTVATFAAAVTFWLRVTGSQLSPSRGEFGEFATLLPSVGDAYLRVQRIQSAVGGSHLDLHVADVEQATAMAVAAGAAVVPGHNDIAVLRSPAGLVFCLVSHHGERTRPPARDVTGGGDLALVDQLCLDIPEARYDDECLFWERVTGWRQLRTPVTDEFRRLDVPVAMPLRLLLQRRRDDHGPARCHIDIAATNRRALTVWMEDAGARTVSVFERWTVMTDPAAVEFCVTDRDPRTGTSQTRWTGSPPAQPA